MTRKILALLFLFIVVDLSFAQELGVVDFSVTIVQAPLVVGVVNGATYENLIPGISYEAIAIENGVAENINRFNGEESFSPALIEIDGIPNAQIFVTFSLPRKLFPKNEGSGVVNMTYDHLSGSLFNPVNGNYHFFNPENGFRFNFPNNGERAIIYIGGNPTISPFAPVDEFFGIGIVTVEYS
ncbi:MAG: hypothetical protein HZB59_04800 [Ignavibacteriales bacterium]|nr:hypothetical protein [Ignavibacteriales bacterium]